MRHAYAGPSSKDPKRERERPLTPEGKSTARAIAEAMGDLGEIPSVIFCSPFARTIQTADIVGKALGVKVDILGDLAPNIPLEETILNMIGADHLKRVMIVGHVDNTTPAFQAFESKEKWEPLVRAEIRRLEIDRKDACWELKWCLCPADLGLNNHEDEDD